jgi:fatty-acyl-CoA synthase
VLARGGMVVVREGFSASQFWKDIVRWDCTLFQYIGELCRYLLNTDAGPHAAQHRIRMCCGNGLGPDIWNTFKTRFGIPQILEFYASTEGNVSLFNVDGREGSIGRTPSFLAHRFQATLVRFDVEKQAPIRSEDGFCIRCEANEPGEALGKILPVASDLLHAFDGYTSTEATEAKILHNVFEPGDRWFRTGDLMRKDDKGYFYFVDRIGDTYRWKGENVASSEVSEAICSFPGIKEASVYGVAIPNADGRTGMAAVVTDDAFELAAFRKHLMGRLPTFAQPLFLRIRSDLPVTATFKHTKNDLQQQGYNPAVTSDAVYFNDPKCGAFVRLDQTLYNRIQTGQKQLPSIVDTRTIRRQRPSLSRSIRLWLTLLTAPTTAQRCSILKPRDIVTAGSATPRRRFWNGALRTSKEE